MLENIAQRLSRLWARVANLNELPGNSNKCGALPLVSLNARHKMNPPHRKSQPMWRNHSFHLSGQYSLDGISPSHSSGMRWQVRGAMRRHLRKICGDSPGYLNMPSGGWRSRRSCLAGPHKTRRSANSESSLPGKQVQAARPHGNTNPILFANRHTA